MTLIYAGIVPRKPGTRSEELQDLQRRAKLLFEALAIEGARIVLPTVCLAELLVPVHESSRGRLVAELSKSFQLRSFDDHAAAVAAELWGGHKKLPKERQYRERVVLKSDVMIVATAKAAGASRFYTHDTDCRKLAAFVMEGRDLPTRDERLFSEKELREATESDDERES